MNEKKKKPNIINIKDCIGRCVVFDDRMPDLRKRIDVPKEFQGIGHCGAAHVIGLSASGDYVGLMLEREMVQETIKPTDSSPAVVFDVLKTLQGHGLQIGSQRVIFHILWFPIDEFCDDEHSDRRFRVLDFIKTARMP